MDIQQNGMGMQGQGGMNTPTPPVMPPPSPMMESPKKTQIGPVIGLIIILAIIVVGTLYFWGQRVEKTQNTGTQNTQTEQTTPAEVDTQTEQLQTQSTSDDIYSIEADLEATDLGDIDSGSELLE